jgi:hypothetical protein
MKSNACETVCDVFMASRFVEVGGAQSYPLPTAKSS